MSRLSAAFALCLLALSVRAAPNEDVKNACKEIGAVAPVVYSGSAYKAELKEYWSYACVETKPYCIVQPTSAEHVSEAVKILNKFPAAQFAVKSGGHDPNVGHSSISDGVLIALGRMRGATYDRARDVAYVKPGGKWANVIGDLAPFGVTVVGGRLSVVGVGGLVLSGGLSFLSAQHGLAADNILELETVFPNGTIAMVNAQNNPTLLRAMKGSNTQFGIVTKMTLKTYQIGNIYGGQKIYGPGSEDLLVEAFQDFTENPIDPKAAVIVTLEKIGSTVVPLVFYFYQAPSPPQGVFKKFEDIRPLYDNTKTQPYLNLLVSNAFGGASLSTSQRASFRSATFPNLPGDQGQLQKDVIRTWKDNHNKYRGDADSPILINSLALQSFQTYIGEQSEKKGGNAMGLSSTDSPRWVAEFTTLWTSPKDDELVHKLQTNAVDVAEAISKMIVSKAAPPVNGKRVENYLPFFMNDAGKGQEVTKSFREYETFKILQKEIDPNGLFQRAGGFKY